MATINTKKLVAFGLTSAAALVSVLFTQFAYAGTLSCSIVPAGTCTGGSTTVLRFSGSSNGHAELSSGNNLSYDGNVVCCTGVTGLGTSCTAPSATLVKLSGTTNAHVEQSSQVNYANSACISVPSGGTIVAGYQASNCNGYDTTIGSMSGITNAHIGTSTAYTTKICASATSTPAGVNISGTLTSSVFDSTITSGAGYNSIMWNGTLGTGGVGKVRFQLATADANTGPWTYYGGPTCGTSDWFDAPTPGTPVELKGVSCQTAWNNKRYFRYKIQLCSNDCITNSNYTPTVTGVIVNWTP